MSNTHTAPERPAAAERGALVSHIADVRDRPLTGHTATTADVMKRVLPKGAKVAPQVAAFDSAM